MILSTHILKLFFVDLDMKKYLFTAIFIAFTFKANILAQDFNADPLSETPLYPIPSEMTFEEYEDMNRRLSQAYLWSSIPIPGSTHYYAGEKRMAGIKALSSLRHPRPQPPNCGEKCGKQM